MKQFMHQNAGEFPLAAIERNAPLTEKRARMHRAAPVAKTRNAEETNRLALDARQASQ